MLTTVLAVGLAVLGALKDPCTLVTTAEVQALAPGAKIGPGVSAKMQDTGISCEWKWGTGNGAGSLTVSLVDNAKAYPGVSLPDLKQGLMAQTAVQGATAVAVSGVGAGAVFDSRNPNRAEATALTKSVTVNVALFAPDGRAMKGQVISLLKSAVGRLVG